MEKNFRWEQINSLIEGYENPKM